MKKLTSILLVCVLLTTYVTAYASTQIKSVAYNTNKITYKGKELVLDKPLISVIDEGSENVSNYMPVRAVLETMGYSVEWDAENATIRISEVTKQASIQNADKGNKKLYKEFPTVIDFEYVTGIKLSSSEVWESGIEYVYNSTSLNDNVVKKYEAALLNDGFDYYVRNDESIPFGTVELVKDHHVVSFGCDSESYVVLVFNEPEPVQLISKEKIITEVGDEMESIIFSDGFVLFVSTKWSPLINSYNSFIIRTDTTNCNERIDKPGITFSTANSSTDYNRAYLEYGNYSSNFPQELKESAKEMDYFTQFESNKEKDSISGMVVFEGDAGGAFYYDGIHRYNIVFLNK